MKSRIPTLALPLGFILLAVFAFPSQPFGSGAFYASALFLALALVLSSPKRFDLAESLAYLLLVPKRGEGLRLLAWGFAALISFFLITVVLDVFLISFGLLDNSPVEDAIRSLPPLVLLSAVVLAPLAEEMFFRGYLFRKLAEKIRKLSGAIPAGVPAAASAVASSAFFALLHFSYGSVSEIIVAFSIGFALCAFTQKSGSLYPAIFAHASYNLLSILYVLVLA